MNKLKIGQIFRYPKFEGYMILFPARLRHCVYPFYETNEPRISIAGNLSYSPDYKMKTI